MRDLTRGPIRRHILAMAAPFAVGMLVQTLYFLVDLYFVSRLGSVALAGVSAASNVLFLLMALTQTLSVGVISVVSQAVGAEDQARANLAFNNAVLLAGALAGVTLVGGYLGLANLYLSTIAADEATLLAGLSYLRYLLPGLALQFAMAALGGALQGTGIVKPTMMVQLAAVLVNVVLTPILVAGWGTGHPLGVAGAGLASSLAALAAVSLLMFYFIRLERYIAFDFRQLRPRLEVLGRMLGIGAPSGGELALLFVYIAVIYSVISGFGADAQAGFGVGIRMHQAIFLPALAIALATPAITGQNFGAKDAGRVRETFRSAATMICLLMLGLTLLCQWRPEWIVGAFSSDPQVREVAVTFTRIVSWNFVTSGLSYTCSGVFQGLGNTLPSLAATGLRLLTFVIPAFWLSHQEGFQIEHIWYLSVATVALQAMVALLLLRRELNRRLRFDAPAERADYPGAPRG